MTIFQTKFEDLVVDDLEDMTFSGIATLEFDEDWEQLFCTKIELQNLAESNSLVTIYRRNKDQRYNKIFNAIKDVLTLQAASRYATIGQFIFHKSI